MQLVLSLMLLLSNLSDDNFEVKLTISKLKLSKPTFFIEKIFDARVDKEHVGSAMTGLFNIRKEITLKGGTIDAIKSLIDYSLPFESSKTAIFIRIEYLKVNEYTGVMAEYAEAKINMSFYKKQNGFYGKLFEAEGTVEKSSTNDVSDFHSENIKYIIEDCLIKFSNSGWAEKECIYNISEDEIKQSHTKESVAQFQKPDVIVSNVLNLGPTFGLNSSGFELMYLRFEAKGDDWIYPYSFYGSFSKVENKTKHLEGTIGGVGFGFGGLKKIKEQTYSLLNLKIPFGNESITMLDGSKVSNFYLGFEGSESIIYIPEPIGLTFSLGLFQSYYINSDLYPWDLGAKGTIGFVF